MADDRYLRGKAIRDEAYGKDGTAYWENINRISPTHARMIHEYVFGTIWDGPDLDLKTRGLITIAVAATLDAGHEVGQHTRGFLNRGGTKEEVIATILQCSPYIGFPKTNHALKAAQAIFDQWEEKREEWKPLYAEDTKAVRAKGGAKKQARAKAKAPAAKKGASRRKA